MARPVWAEAISKRRGELGITQLDLAIRAGISESLMRKVEAGIHHPKQMSVENFGKLLGALNWSLESALEHGIEMPDALSGALGEMQRLEVTPDWVGIQVVGVVEASFDGDRPNVVNKAKGEIAYFPKEKMKGSNLRFVKSYLVNGDCMITEEAKKAKKGIAHGDYIAVEIGRAVEIGDVVVGWWVKKQKMIIKRFGIDKGRVVLYPANPVHPALEMDEDEFIPIGKFLARTG